MSYRLALIRDSVAGVVYHDSDVPPPNQEARLERALRRLFPADTKATLAVYITWSGSEAAWHLRDAITTLGDERLTITKSLRTGLLAAGLPIVDT